MAATVARLLREYRVRLLLVAAGLAGWFALILGISRTAARDLAAQTQAFDSALTRGFGLGAMIDVDALVAQLVGVSFNHPVVLAIVGAITIAPAARAGQGELRDGTLDLVLARALSRTRYLLAYVAFIVAATAAATVVIFASIIGFHRLFDAPGTLDPADVGALCVNAFAIFLCFGAIALLASVLLGRRGNAVFAATGVLVVMFALTFADRAWSTPLLETLAPLSVFHWLDPAPALQGAWPEASAIVVPLAASAALTAIAVWCFERRDL